MRNPEIGYHAILGSIPPAEALQIAQSPLEYDRISGLSELLDCNDIMYIRPVGQSVASPSEDTPNPYEWTDDAPPLPIQADPIIALLDGLPLAGHKLLQDRLIIDDPDNYETAYQANQRIHGTAMASLICHGDLNAHQTVDRQIYVRPIMKPKIDFNGNPIEEMPKDVLTIDLIHRAVRRLYESEFGDGATAPTVRVVNLSLGDKSRPLGRSVSTWAKLLDWLSWKYKVLFVVSAGNCTQDIDLDVTRANFYSLSNKDRKHAIVQAIADDTRNRRLLSPAETLNGLTVGATHDDGSSLPAMNYLIDPLIQTDIPSVYTAHGPGYRRSIKPDVLLPGGRQFVVQSPIVNGPNVTLRPAILDGPPGQRVASPGPPGQINHTAYPVGTSNSAALASHHLHFLYDVINVLRSASPNSFPESSDAVLLKALLVHGAAWDGAFTTYENILKNSSNSRRFRPYAGRFLGYGSVDLVKSMVCTDQRATALRTGELTDGEADEYRFPLPPSLAMTTHKRRLTITLAWLTPVNVKNQKYRIAQLWFNPTESNPLTLRRYNADHNAVRRGTVQHEILEGANAEAFQDGESTVIKVNCRAEAGSITDPIPYALIVTLEVPETAGLPIYQEVRDRVAVRVRV